MLPNYPAGARRRKGAHMDAFSHPAHEGMGYPHAGRLRGDAVRT